MASTKSDSPGDGKVTAVLTSDDAGLEGTKTNIRSLSRAPLSGLRDRPLIILIDGGNLGEMHLLRQRETLIGRTHNADLRIEDDGVSRRHARLTLEDGDVSIEDLGSANGTLVNGATVVSRRLLQDGDKISLGPNVILRFAYGDDVDVTFQKKMMDAALRDALTGAFNKRYLTERLATELAFAQRHKTPLAVIMLDVDLFKTINDSFGHLAGDEVLVALSRAIQQTLRREDVFARYGGEEFLVLCRSIDATGAAVLAERLRERIAAMVVEHEGERIPVTVSLGVAGFPEIAAAGPDALIEAADQALYEAKRAGRNRVALKRDA
jgi:diguanylate cyclase (GGDEF)-like protein